MSREGLEDRCPCGQPLHYSRADHRRAVELLIDQLGPTLRVEVAGQAWAVPRHYIALHGIKGDTLGEIADQYGFERVP